MNILYKSLIINFCLFLTAVILGIILIPLGIVFAFLRLTLSFRFKALLKGFSQLLLQIAISIDQLGNTACAYLFNATLIKEDIYAPFGDPDETISSVLGRNKLLQNLTKTGILLDKILNLFDENHSIESIGG